MQIVHVCYRNYERNCQDWTLYEPEDWQVITKKQRNGKTTLLQYWSVFDVFT